MKDVKKGNYFSLRRYLTPLQLYDPIMRGSKSSYDKDDGSGSGDKTNEITSQTVCASLSSLSTDIDGMALEPMNFIEKISTIPPNVLISAVGTHLKQRDTAEYAIRVLASLLMLGNVVGNDSFALAVYEGENNNNSAGGGNMKHSESGNTLSSDGDSTTHHQGEKKQQQEEQCEIVNDVLSILEWNGSDSRSLSALEQAVKVIYYVTEPNFIESAISKRESGGSYAENNDDEGGERGNNDDGGPIDVDEVGMSMHDFIKIDLHRAFRSMLDHATSSTSPSLQRWATATLRHLITEDRRRACIYSTGPTRYESFMSHLVSTGGIMILCSLLSCDDSETRTHATSTLEAIVISTREISLALNTSPGAGGFSRVGRGTEDDASIVDAIVSNGGCGPALAHLLISADESVALMGCSFASALISPLLTDPRGSGQALQQISTSGVGIGFDIKDDGLSSYRQAALSLVVGGGNQSSSEVSCLPSLIQILRSGVESTSWEGNPSRSIKLQVVAGECLAAISLAIGHILSIRSTDASTSADVVYVKAQQALEIMEQERMYDVAFRIVTSASSHSLDASRNTPQARLREAAGLSLLALSSCSTISSSYLISNKAVPSLLTIASESLDAPSALRGEWASRGLCYLETASQLILQSFQSNDASCLNLLLGALDAGAVGLASKLVKAKVHLRYHDKAYRQMRLKMATCYMLTAMFGIAKSAADENGLGASRLYSAVDADAAQALAYSNESEGRADLVASTVFLLSATLPYAQRFANEDKDEPLPMMDLSQACLLAVGSMCGASSLQSYSICENPQQDKYSHLRQDASSMACRALTTAKDGSSLLPSVLIGALGGCLVTPALRLCLAIAQYAPMLRGDLAGCGMIVPLVDILQQSLSSGDRYTFSMSIAITRYCGPCTNVASNNGSIASLTNAIRTLSTVLTISAGEDDHMNEVRRKSLTSLKFESLLALEALSINEALQSTLVTDAFPALIEFLLQNVLNRMENSEMNMDDRMVCSALKTIQRIISLPSSISPVALKGLITSLVKILNQSQGRNADEKKQEVALELLHSIALGKRDIAGNSCFLFSGVLESVASLLEDSTAKVTSLGLDIIEFIISDFDNSYSSASKDNMTRQFVSGIKSQEPFMRALIATMLVNTKELGDGECSITHLYRKPLCISEDGSDSQQIKTKAIKVLFGISSILCTDSTGDGKDIFLNALLLKNVRGGAESVALACSQFLHLLMDEENGVCVPQDSSDRALFFGVKLPVLRSQLLNVLSTSLDECLNETTISLRKQAEALVRDFKIPQLCLLYCQSKAVDVSAAAFDLYENIVLPLPIDVLGDLLLAEKSSLVALFDLVTGQHTTVPDLEHSKQTFALTLGNLAKAGSLSTAVEQMGVRNHAIAALCAAIEWSVQDGNIDENEDSLPRICVESLAVILCDNEEASMITVLEAKIMVTAIGKTLSATLLNRFFTQASLETTIDYSVDHSSDRSAISQSAEARLLCLLSTFPESLNLLTKLGGLEAIGLIAYEGEIDAIRAIQKACELNPKSVIDVDAHLSIMDALVQVEGKLLSTGTSDTSTLCKTVVSCMQIITTLSQNTETKLAVLSSEQSFGCLTSAAGIISASSKSLCSDSERGKEEKGKNPIKLVAKDNTLSQPIDDVEGDVQLGDPVLVEPTASSSPSKNGQSDEKLEGIVAHLGPVQFAPGDEWIGIRLTGTSTGKGKNDGTVKGIKYFDAGDGKEKNGMFAKKHNVRKQKENMGAGKEASTEGSTEGKALPPVSQLVEQESIWGQLLLKDDLTLERAALSLLQSFASSKPHLKLLMQSNGLIGGMINIIQLELPSLTSYQCVMLDLILLMTHHLNTSDINLTELFCSVVESRMRTVQVSRDKREQLGSKRLLALATSGLHNTFSSFMNVDEQVRSVKITSDLFVYLVDSLYKGPKSRRSAALVEDGQLFCNLSSFFVLSLGSRSLMSLIRSTRFVSSLIRYIMMTSGGVESLNSCHIPYSAKNDGGEYWDGALSFCLYCLSEVIINCEEISGASLAAEVEPSPNSFQLCLIHVADTKHGVSSVSAKQILAVLSAV